MNLTRFLFHRITLFDMNSKCRVVGELERCFRSIWTSKFYDKNQPEKNRIVGEIKCFQWWCINLFQLFGCGLDFFNEFRSPKINSSNFFYGQLTCISIDIQNLFSFYCFHLCPKKCMHTHSSGSEKRTKSGSSSRSSIKFSHKNCVLIVSLRTTRNEKGRKNVHREFLLDIRWGECA